MGLALMSAQEERAEYTEFGTYAFKLMIDRNIRTPTEMARRIKAKEGYPLRISGQTVGNYFKGLHRVPPEFLHYMADILNDAKPLMAQEVQQLGELFAWRQRPTGSSGVTAENLRKAESFMEQVRVNFEAEMNSETPGIGFEDTYRQLTDSERRPAGRTRDHSDN